MKALKIACIGEAMIEMLVDKNAENATLGVAGDSMNTAIYLARETGAAHHVAFVTMLGTDSLSDRIVSFIRKENVSTEMIVRHPTKAPGLYSIKTNSEGERSFAYWRTDSAAKQMFSAPHGIDFDALLKFDVLFLSAISLAILPQTKRQAFFNWLEKFRERGGQFVFDSNYRPILWEDRRSAQIEITRAWQHCDIALPSLDDEMALFDNTTEADVLKRLNSYGIKVGALKRGELGPKPLDGDQSSKIDQTFSPINNVVDTTAAGDSFNGAFLASYLTTRDTSIAMEAGHRLASRVVQYSGAIM